MKSKQEVLNKIAELKSAGYKVEIRHFREYSEEGELCPKGGETSVTIVGRDGSYKSASARCSETEPFCKSLGIRIALGRLLKSIS